MSRMRKFSSVQGTTSELVVNYHPWSKSNPRRRRRRRSCRPSIFIHGNPLHIDPSFYFDHHYHPFWKRIIESRRQPWVRVLITRESTYRSVAGYFRSGAESQRDSPTILLQIASKSRWRKTRVGGFFSPIDSSDLQWTRQQREKLEWLVPWRPRRTGYCSGRVWNLGLSEPVAGDGLHLPPFRREFWCSTHHPLFWTCVCVCVFFLRAGEGLSIMVMARLFVVWLDHVWESMGRSWTTDLRRSQSVTILCFKIFTELKPPCGAKYLCLTY